MQLYHFSGAYGPTAMIPRRAPSMELHDDTVDYADQLHKRQMYADGHPVSGFIRSVCASVNRTKWTYVIIPITILIRH